MEYILLSIVIVLLFLAILLLFKINGLEKKITDSNNVNNSKVDSYFKNYGNLVADNQRNMADLQDRRLSELNTSFNKMRIENEQKLTYLTSENNRQLENIRKNVDEKLQKTLDERLSQSFKLVNERLEQVYKGLGE